MLGKLLAAADHYAVQEPATGGVYNARAGHILLRAHFTQEKPFPPAVSLQCCLLTKVNTVPASKRKIFKGPSSIFTEHAQIVNLELEYLITDTVHALGYSVSVCTLLHVGLPIQQKNNNRSRGGFPSTRLPQHKHLLQNIFTTYSFSKTNQENDTRLSTRKLRNFFCSSH